MLQRISRQGNQNATSNRNICYNLLVECFQPLPASATTLHFEFYAENPTTDTNSTSTTGTKKSGQTNFVTCIHIENVDKLGKTPAQIMNDLLKVNNVPQDRQVNGITSVNI